MGSQAKSITKKPQVAAEQYYDLAARRNRMVDEVRELVRYRDLVRNLVRRNVTAI